MKCVFYALLAMVVMLLVSCIDGEEEVFIGGDGSAWVKAVYRVPGVLFSAEDAEELRADIEKEVGEQENLTLVTNRVDKEGGNRVITLEIATDDIMSLDGALAEHTLGKAPSNADEILHSIVGNITVNLDGLSASLSRKVDLGPLLDKHLGGNGASLLGDSEFRYVVHLPEAAETSNAHEVANGGRTLKWAYKLSECGSKPITLSMVAPIPLPWWVYVLIFLTFLVLVWAAWKWVALKSRRSHTV